MEYYRGEIKVRFEAENGYSNDVPNAEQKGLIKNKIYRMVSAAVSRFHTYITLENFKGNFNSVMFTFFDDKNNEIDIVKTAWNPYLCKDGLWRNEED